MPILNGVNHIEELIFVAGLGVAVSGGTFVPIPEEPITAEDYQADIAAVLGVSTAARRRDRGRVPARCVSVARRGLERARL